MPAHGYEFYLLVVNSISHEWAQRTSEISSWPREDKIHIHARACNILYFFCYFKFVKVCCCCLTHYGLMNISLPVELWMLTSSPGKEVKEVDAFLTFAILLTKIRRGEGRSLRPPPPLDPPLLNLATVALIVSLIAQETVSKFDRARDARSAIYLGETRLHYFSIINLHIRWSLLFISIFLNNKFTLSEMKLHYF